MSTLTLTIAGTARSIKVDSFSLTDRIEERSKCKVTIDTDLTVTFSFGQRVTVTDSVAGLLFAGIVNTDDYERLHPNDILRHDLEFVDLTFDVDRLVSSENYTTSKYAGIIVADHHQKYLSTEGITAAYAMRIDDSQAEFAAGTLSNTTATSDGYLELSPAGTSVTVTETTTANFSTGTLTNCTAASDTLAPTATSAIKLQATESLTYDENAYIYFKIYDDGGLISIISGRYLEYDIWISDDSPEIRAGVDIIFTDGTTMRDTALPDYRYYDDQHIRSHPGEDQSGFANGKWRHRSFWLESFVGKTISHVDVAIEGNAVGTYTAYFKNILETNGSGTTINTFFSGTLNTQKQMQNSGYSDISLSVVSTYDCGSTSQRISGSTSVSAVDILKSSIISWNATEPDNTSVQIEYSLDGGNSYTVCTNGAALPNLPAGLDLASKSIQFRQTFLQLDGASPESKPILNDMTCTLNTSYVSTKSDVAVSACTAGEWATGTLTNTQTSSGILQITGSIREWSGANLANMTIYGGGASGTGPVYARQHCDRGVAWVGLPVSMEGRSRLDFAGTWANGIVEVDVYVDVTWAHAGIVYRTTGWSNYDSNYAYAVEVYYDSIKLQRGSNSSAASTGTRTELASATLTLSSAGWHRLKVVFSGSSHSVYLDDVLMLSETDGTYTAAGYIGLRASNNSAIYGYQGQFNNFGVCGTGLSGTWLSASQSLTGASTYGGSVVSWDDESTNEQDTTLLVESTVNGGTSYQTVTNGGSIQNLTLGQSLSGVSVQFRITLTTASASSLPQIQYFVARVLGGFSSSGTRISPALLLTNAGRVGDTLVAWNASTPTSTAITIATSPTGSGSWTDRSSGDEIAGITSQPDLVLDTFNTDTSANYTSTNVSGGGTATWTYATSDSRISGASGTDGIFRYDGLSIADAYVEADLDQADNAGVVCRMTGVSSMYALFLWDSLGTTHQNYFILSRITAGPTYTTLASGSTTFTRGNYYRFRLSCVGTTISALKDGEQLASVTDATISAAGYSGLIATTLIRCYNLRIQGYGDDLTGDNAYTRATLTSTDPTATPQLQDLTLAALGPDIAIGTLVSDMDCTGKHINKVFDDAATASDDWLWFVRPSASLVARARQADPAPWILTGNDTMITDGPRVKSNGDNYRNRQVITNVDDGAGGTTIVTRNNTGGFTGTISQSDFATLTGGGSGIVTNVIDGNGMSAAEAAIIGDGLLQEFGTIGKTITFRTERAGLSSGQYLTAIIPEMLLNDVALLVVSVQKTYWTASDNTMQYSVEACDGPNSGSWAMVMGNTLKG